MNWPHGLLMALLFSQSTDITFKSQLLDAVQESKKKLILKKNFFSILPELLIKSLFLSFLLLDIGNHANKNSYEEEDKATLEYSNIFSL